LEPRVGAPALAQFARDGDQLEVGRREEKTARGRQPVLAKQRAADAVEGEIHEVVGGAPGHPAITPAQRAGQKCQPR